MLGVLHDLLGRRRSAEIPPGVICYAVGDVHGRLDLLDRLLAVIGEDAAKSPGQRRVLILLGDYVDRGPASRGVVDRLLELAREAALEIWTLKGNHEEALLSFLDDPRFGAAWSEHGGGATLLSYGVAPPRLKSDEAGWTQTHAAFREALPADHLDFFRELDLVRELGDYVFVHAGVKPGRPLERQLERDLLWIREEFLALAEPLAGRVVVHGHTPMEEPQTTRGRIGVDTGAYATGVLTAVRLEGRSQLMLQVSAR